MALRLIWLVASFFIFSSAAAKATEEFNFPKKQLKISNVTIDVEIADTPKLSSRGLMFRQSMPEKHGMLFIFNGENIQSFWMKNTFLPLSIGFFNSKKTLVDIQDMEPVKSEMDQNPKSYLSRSPAQYALEVNQGWFKRNKIKIGDRFEVIEKTGPKK